MSSSSQNPTSNSSPESSVRIAEIRLAQYGQRTGSWSVATYDSGSEKALHEIALAFKAELDRVRAELAALEAAAFGDAKVRLFTPVDQIRHLHTALARQMARAETVSRLATEQRQRADKAEAELAELEKDPSPLLCADCGHPEGAHQDTGEDECNSAGAELAKCTCVYFIPRGGA